MLYLSDVGKLGNTYMELSLVRPAKMTKRKVTLKRFYRNSAPISKFHMEIR